MKLLKNSEEFDEYCDEGWIPYEYKDKRFPSPVKYPCYAYTVVTSWGMEESEPKFLYLEDIYEMLQELRK